MTDIKRIKALFDACQNLTPEQQQQYLQQTDATGEETAQVVRLLGHVEQSSQQDFAKLAEHAISANLQEFSSQIHQGQQLGAYRIIEEIGRGGMGVVFLAERADGQYQQHVAIKLAPSFANADEQQRFSAERQLLASLQHPNIAMLLDGGVTDDQRPYLVMEYVKGVNLRDYCQQQQLSITQRLTLLLNVCDAVSYAHNRLVIHRDIKSENVLVTDEGRVKLLDFGTSKLLQPHDDGHVTQLVAMTLSCASPEQISGAATTTATDVYGLGTLLYQLLTDRTPYHIDKENMAATFDSILHHTPDAPSVHGQHIAADLDNICLKALEKLPERRYGSVTEFKLDLQRFLRGEVVLATKPSVWYRLGKVVKRHPLPVALSVALVLALSTGLVVSSQLNIALTQERNRLVATQADLQQQTHTAEKVIELLTDMFDAASPENAQGEAISVSKLVTAAVAKTRNTLTQQPEVKAQLLKVLSKVLHNIGQDQQAVTLMEEAFALKQQSGEPSAVDLAELGDAYAGAGQFEQALKYLQQSEQLAQAPGVSEQDKAFVNYELGVYYSLQSQFAEALRYLQLAQNYWLQYPDQQDSTSLDIRFKIAYVYYFEQKHEQAIGILNDLLADTERLFGANHPQNLETLRMLANSYRHLGDYVQAEQAIVRAYQLAQKILEPDTQLIQTITQSYVYLLTDQGRYSEEIAIIDRALAQPLTNPLTIGSYYSDRGQANLELGNFRASKADFEQALTLLRPSYADSNLHTFPARLFLAYSRSFLGEAEQADREADSLFAQAEQQFQEGDYNLGLVALVQGKIALNHQDLTKAEAKLQYAKTIFDSHFPADHVANVTLLRIQGDYQQALGQWAAARDAYERSGALAEKYHPPGSVEGLLIKLELAQTLWQQGQQTAARTLVNEVAPRLEQQLTADSYYYQIAKQLRQLMVI